MQLRGYIRGFDGIRAYAVLIVLGIHTGLPAFEIGWSGVNCFAQRLSDHQDFAAHKTPTYFSTFYARRALRIFPAYYVVIFATLAIAALKQQPRLWIMYFPFYIQNIAYALIGQQAVRFPYSVAHSWSLAVEEQFYLLWPLVVWALSVTALRRVVIALICIGLLLALSSGALQAAIGSLPTT